MDKGMNLSGQLADWTMDDLLQIVQVTKKTGSLDIVGARKGRVHFREGAVTGAELHSSRGVYAGTDPSIIADVVFVLGSMEEGAFAMGPADGPDVEGVEIESISKRVTELRDIETEVSEQGLIGSGQVVIKPTVEKDVSFTPEDWSAIASLVQPFTFEGLEERLGRGAAVRMIHAFHRLGIVDVAPEEVEEKVVNDSANVSEEESNWLDRLADEVSATDSTKWLEEAASQLAEESPAQQTPAAEPAAAAPAEAPEEEPAPEPEPEPAGAKGVAAPASTVLTTGVYDDIRRLRSKVTE